MPIGDTTYFKGDIFKTDPDGFFFFTVKLKLKNI